MLPPAPIPQQYTDPETTPQGVDPLTSTSEAVNRLPAAHWPLAEYVPSELHNWPMYPYTVVAPLEDGRAE